MPEMPDTGDSEGLRVLSAPVGMVDPIGARFPRHVAGGFEQYRRFCIDMAGSYEDYLRGFSGKTRSTLKRKRRKLEAACGGRLDLREYRTPDEIGTFLDHALPLSRKTYQARLLAAGLPASEAAREAMTARAERGDLRAFLLFKDGEPLAYLYLPVEGATLVYAHLGYAPEAAKLSAGTVLQMAALERLFAEERFRWFDFTEGEGAHKAMFATGSVECASFYLLEPTAANRALLASLAVFDKGVAGAKALARRSGADPALRRLLRR